MPRRSPDTREPPYRRPLLARLGRLDLAGSSLRGDDEYTTPSISRNPSASTPVATMTAILMTRPPSRTFIVGASAATTCTRRRPSDANPGRAGYGGRRNTAHSTTPTRNARTFDRAVMTVPSTHWRTKSLPTDRHRIFNEQPVLLVAAPRSIEEYGLLSRLSPPSARTAEDTSEHAQIRVDPTP